MSKLLELNFAYDGNISGTSGGTTYTVINSSGGGVSTTGNNLEFGPTVDDVSKYKYGYVDLNSFHDTNRAFTIEFTLSDNSLESSRPYNYVAIGKKTYSTMHDVITIGRDAEGNIVLGVMSHKESFKTVPLSLPDGVSFDKGSTKYDFQFNYDPNQAIEKRATLYVTNSQGQYLVAELGTVFNDRMVNILDFVLYIGTSGSTNEIGYENKLDLTTGVTFHDKIKVYSGTTMDKETTYFYHSGFSNLAHSVATVCNNKADEVIFTKFKTDNDLVEGSDLTVKLTNAHTFEGKNYENVGEYFSSNNDTLEFAFKFSNLEKVTTTNTFLEYEVSYLNKDFTIEPTTNKMYIDSFTPSLVYNITDIGSDYVEFKIDSIADGDFIDDTSQSDFANYNVTFKAVNADTSAEVTSAEVTKSVDNPMLYTLDDNQTYRITGLSDGVYYNVSAVVTDPAKNSSTPTAPQEVNSQLARRHYSKSSIRTTDITPPSSFTIAKAISSSGTEFSFDVTGISDNATVDEKNPLELFYLLSATNYTHNPTGNQYTDVNQINDRIKNALGNVNNSASKVTFKTATSTFNVPQTTTLSDGTTIEADKNYYFYAVLKDADGNTTIGTNSSNKKFVQFKVENSLTFTSMVSDYSINTLASEANTLTIKFTTAHPVLDNSAFSMTVNGKYISTPTIVADDAPTNKNWTITYSLSDDNTNASRHGYVTGEVNLSITSTDLTESNRSVNLPNTVMLRGSRVTRHLGPYNVFTSLQPNSITTTNHLTATPTINNAEQYAFSLKENDKIIDISGLKKYDVKLYENYQNGSYQNLIKTQNFTALNQIPTTIKFENLTEGQTYYAIVEVTNNLDQSYTIKLHPDDESNVGITTTSFPPEAVPVGSELSTRNVTVNNRPSIEITGFAVNDVHSSYDVYIAALQQTHNLGSLTKEKIKEFFDSVPETKRFDNVDQNTVTNIVASKGSMSNDDGLFDLSVDNLYPKIVKAYNYSTTASEITVSDIAINTTKLVLIAMVRDKSVDENYVTFIEEHNYTYDISNIAFTNVKNPSSNFVKTGDVVNMTFTTNYAVTADKLTPIFYNFKKDETDRDGNVIVSIMSANGVNWTVALQLPGLAGDQSFIKKNNNTTLSINVDALQTKTLTTDIRVDKTAPVWKFGTVTSSADDVINAEVILESDIASAEPMRFLLEASNDGSNATAVDAGKTLVTTDTFLTFGSPSTQSVALNGLSPGLDYFIKGQLWDANSNSSVVSFVNPNISKDVVFTTDSILPTVEVEPNVYPSLEDVRVEGLQVKDNNSIYGYTVAITEETSSFTFTEYKAMHGEGKDVFLNENIARGTTDILDSRTFTKYINSDKTEGTLQSGITYKLVVIIEDVYGSVKLYEKTPILIEYPVVSDTIDTSGAGGELTHLFNYDLTSLTNSLGSPHGVVSGDGNVTYVDGFVGSNAVFLNSNVTDDHSIRVSSESMSNHSEFSFATWLKSYNDTDSNLKTLFYYDNDHYLRIKDSEIQSKWGVAATLSIDTMEYKETDWNHIVMTANTFDTSSPSNVTIYWNSSNINAGGAGITDVPNTRSHFYIGGEGTTGGTADFKGILDDTRIYNSIITSDDVGLLYGAGGNALEITFDETGNLVFSNESGALTQDQITELLDTTDTATGDASITFDGDTTLELSGTQLDGIETTTDGVLTESTVSFWIKPTDDTFAQENTIMEYFASIGYTVTILPNGTLQFDVVDNTPAPTGPSPVDTITFTSGAWSGESYQYRETINSKFIYTWHRSDTGYLNDRAIVYDYTTNTWADAVGITGYGGNIPDSVTTSNNTVSLVRTSDNVILGTFTDPFHVAPTIVNTILITSGDHKNIGNYAYVSTNGTKYQYALYNSDNQDHIYSNGIQYDYSTRTWMDWGSGDPVGSITQVGDIVTTSHSIFTDPYYT